MPGLVCSGAQLGERWVWKTGFVAKEDVLMKYPVKSDTVPRS